MNWKGMKGILSASLIVRVEVPPQSEPPYEGGKLFKHSRQPDESWASTLAPVLSHMQQGISQIPIHHADIAPLNWKAMLDLPELDFTDLHDSKDQAIPGRFQVVLTDVVARLCPDTTWGSTRGDAERPKGAGGPPSFMSGPGSGRDGEMKQAGR